MALFEFGKDEKNAETPQIETPQEEAAEEEKPVLNGGRRFFFVTEAAAPVRGGTVMAGIVHGRIELGDVIYILQPRKPMLRTRVQGMDSKIESYMMKIQTAEDMPVNLFLAVNPADVEKYAVITDVMPQLEEEPDSPVENPVMAALLYEKRLFSDEQYFDWLCFTLIHGRFVTPARLGGGQAERQEKPIKLEKNTPAGFCMLPDPRDKKLRLLPVFTDCEELAKWEGMAEDKTVQTVILSFADLLTLTKQPECSGFVVNPYSPNQSIISREIIRAITESDGYRKEFPD